jgi:chorismate mutase
MSPYYASLNNVISHLFSWLASDTSTAPLLEHLKLTRQDLAFSRISHDEAARQADVALSGLKLTEALHPPISAALTKAEELQSMLADLKKMTDEANGLVSVMRGPDHDHPVNGEKSAELVRLLDSLDRELSGVTSKKSELEKAVAKLKISSQIIVMFSPESKQEVESITQKVAAAIVGAREAEANFTKQIAALKNASNELTQAAVRWTSLTKEPSSRTPDIHRPGNANM